MAKKNSLLILFFFILLNIHIATALENSQITNKLLLNPFYRASMTSNTNYTYLLSINPDDRISKVVSAMVNVDAWMTPTVNYYLYVNGKPCNNPSYQISTTYSGAGRGQLTFDCKNLITNAGDYTITIRADKNSGASTAWIDFTYINNQTSYIENVGNVKTVDNINTVSKVNMIDEPKITMHGTDYFIGENGKVWLQLLNSSFAPITSGTCFISIFYPNGDYFKERNLMNHLSEGIYYNNFVIPETLGVFPATAQCYYQTASSIKTASSGLVITGVDGAGDYTDTFENDGSRWRIDETNIAGVQRMKFIMNFTSITIPEYTTDLVVYWEGRYNGQVGDDLSIYIYNFSSNKWNLLSNKISNTGGVDVEVTNSFNFPVGYNITTSGLISTDGRVWLSFNDTGNADATASNIQSDMMTINLISLSGGQWNEVKGSSELNVKSDTGHLFRIENLCGDYSQNCALFYEDASIWDSFEGLIVDNLTFTNLFGDDLEKKYVYKTGKEVDCSALMEINRYSQNGTKTDIINDILMRIGDKNNCEITLPVVFENGETTIKEELIMQNYMKWDLEKIEDEAFYYNNTISEYCYDYQQDNNLPEYILPVAVLNQSIHNTYTFCNNALDNIYWFYSYYELSLPIQTTGGYESYLYEGQFFVHLIRQDYLVVNGLKEFNKFSVETLCGNELGDCAIFEIDNEIYNGSEGILIENLTITNLWNDNLESSYYYATATGLDCTGILYIYRYNENGSIEDITSDVVLGIGNKENCNLDLPITFESGETVQKIEIIMDNYPKWEIQYFKDVIDRFNQSINEHCEIQALASNYTYTIPMVNFVITINDTELKYCERALDNLYWFYQYYDLSLPVTVIGEYESYLLEARFYYPLIRNDMATVTQHTIMLEDLIILDDMQKSLHKRIWNYTDRTLTSINSSFTVNVNETKIAEGVWSWDGSIGETILDAIANKIWQFLGGVAEVIS